MNDFSKDMLVEQPTIELFSELEYEATNCFRGNWGKLGAIHLLFDSLYESWCLFWRVLNSQQDRASGSSYHHHGAGESVGCFGGSGRSGCPLHQSLRASRVSLWRRQSLWEKQGPAPGTDSRPAGGSTTFVACKTTTFRVNVCPHLRRITTTQSHKFLCRASQTQTPMAPQAEASPS